MDVNSNSLQSETLFNLSLRSNWFKLHLQLDGHVRLGYISLEILIWFEFFKIQILNDDSLI